jgi:hypothetical protein
MQAPLINLDIQDVNHDKALAPSSSYGFHFKSATRLSIPRRFLRHSCYDTIQYPPLKDRRFLHYTIIIGGCTKAYSGAYTHHLISSFGQHKKFSLVIALEHHGKGRATLATCNTDRPIFFLLWLNSTRSLFSMDSKISYHWEGSDGAAWWGRRLDDALMFSCSGLTKSSVL